MRNRVKFPKNNQGRVLMLGCGNVGGVAAHEMAYRHDVFKEIHIASRSPKILIKVRDSVIQKTGTKAKIITHKVDASNYEDLVRLIKKVRPRLVLNLLPPFWNLVVMEACLACGVDYLDTACYENPDKLGFSNEPQLAFYKRFEDAGLVGQLQFGFDPGATNSMVAYAVQENLFDEIYSVDILDCNGGSKNAVFAPNFDPEINLRELILLIKTVHNGEWRSHGRLIDKDAIHCRVGFPEAGEFEAYLMYHEELESLHESFPQIDRMRFWMTFSEDYLTHLRVLKNVGLLRIDQVEFNGQEIIPLQFLKALLPKGEDFNESYVGKTCIGCIIHGIKNGKVRTIYIYQVCDHKKSFELTGGNAIGRTTAVPAVSAVIKILTDPAWQKPGVRVPETRPAKSFLEEMATNGLPCKIIELPGLPKYLDQDFEGEPSNVNEH